MIVFQSPCAFLGPKKNRRAGATPATMELDIHKL
jgi:hypothetical protein